MVATAIRKRQSRLLSIAQGDEKSKRSVSASADIKTTDLQEKVLWHGSPAAHVCQGRTDLMNDKVGRDQVPEASCDSTGLLPRSPFKRKVVKLLLALLHGCQEEPSAVTFVHRPDRCGETTSCSLTFLICFVNSFTVGSLTRLDEVVLTGLQYVRLYEYLNGL